MSFSGFGAGDPYVFGNETEGSMPKTFRGRGAQVSESRRLAP